MKRVGNHGLEAQGTKNTPTPLLLYAHFAHLKQIGMTTENLFNPVLLQGSHAVFNSLVPNLFHPCACLDQPFGFIRTS